MDWQWFTAVIGVPVAAALVGWTAILQKRIVSAEKDLSTFMVKTAETYVTKDDVQHLENRLMERLKEMDGKMDRLLSSKCAPDKTP